jgi:hypothetical protein
VNRILVETWCEMAKMCIQHVKPNDIIYVSGHLESYLSFDRTGNPSSSYKVRNLNCIRFSMCPHSLSVCFDISFKPLISA